LVDDMYAPDRILCEVIALLLIFVIVGY